MFLQIFITLLMSYISNVSGSGNPGYDSTEHQRRTTNSTCGDPSLATTYLEAFSPSLKVHGLNILAQYVVVNANFAEDWEINTASFRAWGSSGQPGTVPFYGLFNPTTTDLVYMISTNGAPPTLPGFQAASILTFVYPTQICGSVPLYSVSLQSGANGDHWYTTNKAEHDVLVTNGGIDAGIAAFVLPVDCGCSP
ncbi:hypothetical protein GALMADRAFT_138787 [Galerina marginata CBS 339.88]|uniref:DUF5648 domain-containing protein n=1 Tax=Galerina marginata (strain CBS 339.88) TaxID=685588 RepID=A0A067T3L4_GALM3|nr:hypothetical protein GALMADRAFT_138787 [Galerina marginata CBS 339.88]